MSDVTGVSFNFYFFYSLCSCLPFLVTGTEEERLALEAAIMYGVKKEFRDEDQFLSGFDTTMEFQEHEAVLGSDFKVTITFKNQSSNRYTVSAYLTGHVVFYTGVQKAEFKNKTLQVVLDPLASKRYRNIYILIANR